MAGFLSLGLDSAAAVPPPTWYSVLCQPPIDPARARDGPLPVLPLLPGSRDVAVLHSCSDHDWNAGGGDPDQGADPVAGSAIRHRNCRADCRSYSSGGYLVRGAWTFEAAGGRNGAIGSTPGIPPDFLR